jgi:hypothetical protein
MENYQQIFLTILGMVVVTALLTLYSLRQRNLNWSGVLESKSENQDEESGRDFYTLCFRTDAGKKVKIKVGAHTFHSFNQGDRAVKKKGVGVPERIG